MKRFVLVLFFGLILVGGVFSQHPGGWGIGLSGHGGFFWSDKANAWGDHGNGGAAFSLKAPVLPVFWGLKFDLGHDLFRTDLMGDYYILDRSILSESGFNLGWYIGPGGYFSFLHVSALGTGMNGFALGLRVPIGLDLMFLNNRLEVFFETAPSFGLGFWPDASEPAFFDGGISFSIGGRIWV
jgi:hypothetical protein